MFYKRYKNSFDIKNSQNFITNPTLIKHLISLSNLNKGDRVIEIGAGNGSITRELSKVCKMVSAIELDELMASSLKVKFKGTNVEVIQQDFLTTVLPQENFKVFSNIPFNHTSEILTRLLFDSNATDVYLIMQHEAFFKYAGAPFYADSYKSLLLKPFYESKLLHEFKQTDFSPVPNARIVFAYFRKKEKTKLNPTEWRDFVSYIFSQSGQSFKQKTKHLFSYKQQKLLAKCMNITLSSPFSFLTYESYTTMFNVYCSKVSPDKKSMVYGSYKKMLSAQSSLAKIHRNRNPVIK